jgi:hypothetical protein
LAAASDGLYADGMNAPDVISVRGLRVIAAAALLVLSTAGLAQTVQEHVHGHGHEVMPFDLAKTIHIFRMTEDGGTQAVVLRSGTSDPDQVRMIQHHLGMEAAQFQEGNFTDPVHLHGSDMPGLKEMQAGAPRMKITYRALPNGAEIRFQTNDIRLTTAVHRWFGAQLSEHGADARAE